MNKQIISFVLCLILLWTFHSSYAEEHEFCFDFIERGNTYVLKIDGKSLYTESRYKDSFLTRDFWYKDWMKSEGEWIYVDKSWLKSHVSNDQYEAFTDGTFSPSGFITSFTAEANIDIGSGSDCPMQNRRIGNDYYVVFHKENGDIFNSIILHFFAISISLNGILANHYDIYCPFYDDDEFAEFNNHKYQITHYTESAIYSCREGDLQLSLYKTWDVFTLVIKAYNTDNTNVSDMLFSIEGCDPIPISGYMDGSIAVFCIVIDPLEALAIMKQKNIKLYSCSFDNSSIGH